MTIGQYIRAELETDIRSLSVTLNPFSRYRKRQRITRCIRYTRDIMKRDNVEIGEYTYGTPIINCGRPSWGKLTIGKFCSIAPACTIEARGNHRIEHVSAYPFKAFEDEWSAVRSIDSEDLHAVVKGDVVIGNDVWIGTNATIMAGVTIGDGAVIGAWSVVTADVAPYAIVAGNPARLIRKRFDDDTIRRLLEIKWWDWPKERIDRQIRFLCAPPDPEWLSREAGLTEHTL